MSDFQGRLFNQLAIERCFGRYEKRGEVEMRPDLELEHNIDKQTTNETNKKPEVICIYVIRVDFSLNETLVASQTFSTVL